MRKLLILACTLVLTGVWALSVQAGEAVAKPKESRMAAKLSHKQAEKIRQLLLADLQRVVWLNELLWLQFKHISSADYLAENKNRFSPYVDKEEQFFAAVVLAAHGNSSGVEVLRRYQDYFKTEFGIEGLHALAALALIEQAPEKTPMGAYWRQLSPRLTAELTRYIDETQPVFPAPTSNSTVNRKAETLGYLLLGEIDHIDRFEGWMDSLFDLPLSAEIHTRLKQSLSAKNRKEQFFAAVLLAAYGDASGADILHHHRDYFVTSSGIEDKYARAALRLIDQDKEEEIPEWITTLRDGLAKEYERFSKENIHLAKELEQTSKEKNRRFLLAELKRGGSGDISSILLDPRHSPQLLARLKQLLSGENKEGQFFAAIFLAAHGDASGAEILHHYQDYFTTESGIEGLQALAALALIGQAPEKTPMKSLNWVTMSQHLTAELAEYIDGGIFGSKPVWPEPARPKKAKMGAALNHERAQNVRQLLLKDLRLLGQPHYPPIDNEWITPLLDQKPSAKFVAQLKRQLSDKNKKKQFFAAVLLAAHGDASGVDILRNYQDYHLTETGLESLHALAALALIGQAPEKTPMGTPRWMTYSSKLVTELADYIGGVGGGFFFSLPVP